MPNARFCHPFAKFLLAVACLMMLSCQHTPMRGTIGEFVDREISMDGAIHRYQVFVPSQAAAGRRPPVILFLHGSGERGDDNRKQTAVGLGPYLKKRMATFPAIVVFPQSPENASWDAATARMALATLDAASREFNGDPGRTYLTGMSRGGYGAWELALMQPTRFAALVPVCGGITAPRPASDLHVIAVESDTDPFDTVARRLAKVPVWLFHGARDDVVDPLQSRRMYAALQAADAPARYTEFPDANHNAWDPAYATPELWEWLFAQRRR
ncbi:prolyl oligopeptidase family serine peptidase [Lysobacter sp. CFH 32150]|uniref:carboxylesterase family protein n=1 Tax=Lysobacter sp. CFH 32150 TaxID=2927128 RepID=UPI001FA6C409|nr:prolyl oligopeptidase family serine peptidase [Lysobacter sp. CFH 32150]MCI4568724.1 prolyl oligopeptidase family serine peptidase [Lysobacter sp. CFH 32150]